MSAINPETPQELFEEHLRKLAFGAGFIPSYDWTRKVTNGLFEKYNITEKEGGEEIGSTK